MALQNTDFIHMENIFNFLHYVGLNKLHWMFSLFFSHWSISAAIEEVFYNPTSMTVLDMQSQPAYFQCISGNSLPLATITWEKDGQPLTNVSMRMSLHHPLSHSEWRPQNIYSQEEINLYRLYHQIGNRNFFIFITNQLSLMFCVDKIKYEHLAILSNLKSCQFAPRIVIFNLCIYVANLRICRLFRLK